MDGTLDAGLLDRRRLTAATIQRRPISVVILRGEIGLTTLLGRAAACLGAGKTNPGCASRGLPRTHIVRIALRAEKLMESTMTYMARPEGAPMCAVALKGGACGQVTLRLHRSREAIWWAKAHPTALQPLSRSVPAFRAVR